MSIEILRAATEHHVILEKESPWTENRNVIICAGADLLLTRNAAEEAIRAIIAETPPASDWIRTKYDTELDESVRDYVSQLQYEWDDRELPLEDLTMDVGAKLQGKITSKQAARDLERLFYLLSHGYSGYAFFNQNGEFEQAKARILQEPSSQSSWSTDAFSRAGERVENGPTDPVPRGHSTAWGSVQGFIHSKRTTLRGTYGRRTHV